MPRRAVAVGAVAIVLIGLWSWRMWWPSDPQRIRRQLLSFASDFNETTTAGLGTVAHAAKIGSYFTNDIVVDLGKGTPPIQGRETLIGMAARLQPRTAAFTLELLDINVSMTSADSADVSLTAAFRRRSLTTGEESIDARELQVAVVKIGGEWRVSRVKTVDPFETPPNS
jgi:hypothetical protein